MPNQSRGPLRGSVCVYCSASEKIPVSYLNLAREVGQMLAQSGLGLVYGGGHRGMMGQLADGALEAGGFVYGVITEGLKVQEVAHQTLSELVVVADLYERKRRMMERAEVFVILPGGLGTLDEFFEAVTHEHLGYHNKPTVILDYNGFYSPLLNWIENISAAGFVSSPEPHFVIARSVAELSAFLSSSHSQATLR